MGLPNYEGFIDNRHDQTVLSLLAKKWGIIPFRDPSQWGNDYNYANDIIVRSSYPQIFDSHRCGDISSSYFLYKNKWVKSYITSIKHVYSKIKNKCPICGGNSILHRKYGKESCIKDYKYLYKEIPENLDIIDYE